MLCELVCRNSTGQLFLSCTRGLVFIVMKSQLELVLGFASTFVSQSQPFSSICHHFDAVDFPPDFDLVILVADTQLFVVSVEYSFALKERPIFLAQIKDTPEFA